MKISFLLQFCAPQIVIVYDKAAYQKPNHGEGKWQGQVVLIRGGRFQRVTNGHNHEGGQLIPQGATAGAGRPYG